MLYEKKPHLGDLPVWGAKCWILDCTGSKLDDCTRDGYWVGYDSESTVHQIYLPARKAVVVECNVTFQKDDDIVSSRLEGESITTENGDQLKSIKPVNTPAPIPMVTVTKSPPSNKLKPPDYVGPNFENPPVGIHCSPHLQTESAYIQMLQSGKGTHDGHGGDPLLPRGIQVVDVAAEDCEKDDSDEHTSTAWELNDTNAVFALLAGHADAEGLEPTTINEAKMHPDWPKWDDAIQAKLKSLANAHTWNMVEHPKDVNVVSCKWVFKIKKNAVGEIDKYKARLVARGFMQQYGVDYHETYAPVAQLASLWLILAIAARHNWDIDVFDFHSTFLNSKLDDNEVIYMELPPGFDKQGRNLVACLCIAIYGSKQGALKWYQHLSGTLNELGFTWMEADWRVFVVWIAEHILILASHIDDCTVTGSSPGLIKSFKGEIGSRFQITDLGPISWLLSMKVTQDRSARTISLSQEAYINAILTKYNFANDKPLSIPLDPHIQLSETQSPKTTSEVAHMCSVPYREAIGSLIHLATGTRPDIAFATSFVLQFNTNPGWEHWEAVKWIYHYLVGMKSLALTFGTRASGLVGYVDVDGATQEHC